MPLVIVAATLIAFCCAWVCNGDFCSPFSCAGSAAVDDAQPDNGCMRFVKASHKTPRLPHGRTDSAGNNLLSIHQNIELQPEQQAMIADLPLQPGQASFHHGWVAHGSYPNSSTRRRCGITCIYAPADLAPYVGDPETDKSMRSSLSAVREQANTKVGRSGWPGTVRVFRWCGAFEVSGLLLGHFVVVLLVMTALMSSVFLTCATVDTVE